MDGKNDMLRNRWTISYSSGVVFDHDRDVVTESKRRCLIDENILSLITRHRDGQSIPFVRSVPVCIIEKQKSAVADWLSRQNRKKKEKEKKKSVPVRPSHRKPDGASRQKSFCRHRPSPEPVAFHGARVVLAETVRRPSRMELVLVGGPLVATSARR